ncbi:MAG: polyprenol monophosphomannose synthase [Desulfurococcaceae archaeon]
MEVSIVVPTYNERENVPRLIELIDEKLRGLFSYEVVVVDDNSPDGTAEVAEKLSEKYPVRVLKRPGKLGVTSAIYDGMRASHGRIIVVMDADLQHPPEVIPRLIERSRTCDIVVASRYCPGGGVENWSTMRKLVSTGAVLLARILVPNCSRVKDPVSGFFALRREVAEAWKPIEPRGFKALVEILGTHRNARVCEEPYLFRGRARGSSKLSSNVMLSYVKLLVKLGWRRIALILAVLALTVLVTVLARILST